MRKIIDSYLADEQATKQLAEEIKHYLYQHYWHSARCGVQPFVIVINGDLGTGKTTWVRYLLRTLGYEGTVKSPSYGLLESYEVASDLSQALLRIYHWDWYRLHEASEVEFLGLSDLLVPRTLHLIEWGEKFPELLCPDLVMQWSLGNADTARECRVFAN